MAIGAEGNVKWVDGLRGLASTLVVLTHICRAFDGDLFAPTSAEGALPRVLQLPFLRVLIQGRIGVAIFSFVTGYVCALKPIKQSRQGNQDDAFNSMSRSAIRRVPRLFLPAAIATVIIWIMAQFGFFLVAKQCDSWWAGATAPDRVSSIGGALKSLVYNIITTWTTGFNAYDGNQWTMFPLLKGSMLVYVFILGTAYVQPIWRMLLAIGMFFYFWACGDSAFGMQFFWGIFLCDLQNHPPANEFMARRPRICIMLATICITVGLYIASYPEQHPEWMTWSRWQFEVLNQIVPHDAEFPRFGSGIGLELLTLGIHFSSFIKTVLSTKPLLWLGKQSFAVYLLHGPLLRWLLCWAVYGTISPPEDVQNEAGEWVPGKHIYPGHYKLLIWLPLWIPLNYGVAVLWTTYVDPWCANVSQKLVTFLKRDPKEKEGILLRDIGQ